MCSKDMYKKAYISINHTNSQFETSQIPINRKMLKL